MSSNSDNVGEQLSEFPRQKDVYPLDLEIRLFAMGGNEVKRHIRLSAIVILHFLEIRLFATAS